MDRIIFKNKLQGLVVFLLVAFISSTLFAGGRDTINKKFDVKYGGKLTLVSDKGSIEISTTSSEIVEVTVYKEIRHGDEEDLEDFDVRFNHQNGDVEVIGEFTNGGSSFWGNRHNKVNIKYVITVPNKYNIDAKTSGGSIELEDITGDVNCKTSGGSLRFGDVRGEVFGNTSGGSITLTAVKAMHKFEHLVAVFLLVMYLVGLMPRPLAALFPSIGPKVQSMHVLPVVVSMLMRFMGP